MAKHKTTYNEAQTELEQILQELENDKEINMDQIEQKIKRATELLSICKKQLSQIDLDLEKALEQID